MVDYAYEEEYRIAVDASEDHPYETSCEPRNDYPFPFLYLYLDTIECEGSRYSEVIIGPKSIDIDFLGPYLNYLDSEIGIKKSEIPYR